MMLSCRYCDHPDEACHAAEEAENCQNLADAKEVERILAMPADELRAEMVAQGIDPDEAVGQTKMAYRCAVAIVAAEKAALWHEAADKALSKQPPSIDSQWRRNEHQEQARLLREALVIARPFMPSA